LKIQDTVRNKGKSYRRNTTQFPISSSKRWPIFYIENIHNFTESQNVRGWKGPLWVI